MRIVTQTPERLVIEHRPRSLMLLIAALSVVLLAIGVELALSGCGFVGLLVALLGLVGAGAVQFEFLSHSSVTFDRASGIVCILWQDEAGEMRRDVPLSAIHGAQMQRIRSHEGPAIDRVALVTGGKPVPLTRAFHDSAAPTQITAAINDWISGRTA